MQKTQYHIGISILAATVLLMSSNSSAVTVNGSVLAVDGTPVPAVMVTVHNQAPGPATLSVFSDDKGRFTVPDLPHAQVGDLLFSIRKVGLIQTAVNIKPEDGVITANITVQPIDNVADQVPASAWLADFDLVERGARLVPGQCSGCHQFPADRVKRFVRSLADSLAQHPDSSDVMSRQVWHGMVQYMRNMSLQFSADTGLRWGLTPKQATAFASPKNALFNDKDGDLIVKALEGKFSTQTFINYPLEKYQKLDSAPLGVTSKTVVREYRLMTDGWTREVALSPSTPYPWVVEDNKHRLGRLDTDNGHVRWYPVPSNVQGPHTINADAAGNFWVSMEESYDIARFDPKAEKWETYSGFGKGALVHDFCMDENRQVRYDKKGNLWLTLLGTNKIARVNPKTKEIRSYKMPLPANESIFRTALYGCVMTSDTKHAWFTQLSSSIGSLNLETGKVDAYYEFPTGTVPHRMTIDDKDVVYVALSGDGQIWTLDTRTSGAKPKLYNLPDRNSSPYSVTWDNQRKVLWVATTNNNIIYKFDPASGMFAEYPLPRKDAFMRMIDVDAKTGDLWTTYSPLPVGDGPHFVVQLTPGDL